MKQTHQRLVLAILGSVGIVAALLSFLPARPAFIWNFSASAPVGLYRVLNRPWQKGDWVAVRMSASVEAMLLRYRAPSGRSILLKRVAAKEGDLVCRRGSAITVNGSIAAVALDTSHGVVLPKWTRCQRLSGGEVFLLGKGEKSFDSRYFGPLASSDIQHPVASLGFHASD